MKFNGNDPDWDADDKDDDEEKPKNRKALVRPRPQIVEKRCKVCMHAYRNVIDRMLVLGVSYAQIQIEFAQDDPAASVNRKSLSNHHKKHMTYEDRAIREILEEEAKRVIENVDEAKQTLVTTRGFQTTMLVKAYQMMLDGTLKMEARDIITMIAQMEKMNDESAAVEKEELMREFNLFVKSVKAVVPLELWNDIVAELKRLESLEKSLVTAYVIPKRELPSSENDLDVEAEEEEDGHQ